MCGEPTVANRQYFKQLSTIHCKSFKQLAKSQASVERQAGNNDSTQKRKQAMNRQHGWRRRRVLYCSPKRGTFVSRLLRLSQGVVALRGTILTLQLVACHPNRRQTTHNKDTHKHHVKPNGDNNQKYASKQALITMAFSHAASYQP